MQLDVQVLGVVGIVFVRGEPGLVAEPLTHGFDQDEEFAQGQQQIEAVFVIDREVGVVGVVPTAAANRLANLHTEVRQVEVVAKMDHD